MRIKYVVVLILLGVGSRHYGYGQATSLPVRDGIAFSPRWLDNLMFLNHFDEELPAEKQVLYKWAETGLSMNEEDGFAILSEYGYFQDHCRQHGIRYLGGPMLGNITSSSVDIWVRTVRPAAVRIKLSEGDNPRTFGPVHSSTESELSAVVSLEGLQAATHYRYEVWIGDEPLDLPFETSFRTLPASGTEETRIVFGSCFHRWGLGNTDLLGHIVDRKPHAILLLGDIAAQDKMGHVGWHSLDYLARDLYPAWQNLVSKIPVYATWDDHDYFGNDLWGTPEGCHPKDPENVWKVFRTSWVNPSYGFGEAGKGVFLRTRIGAADVIMLDNRYFRTRDSFLGEAQMEWLEAQLLDCKGPFIILACGTMWSDFVSGGKDSWGTFDPLARERIFSLIEAHDIAGVLLISGDRHGARGFRIPRASGFEFYEFEGASLGGIGGPPTEDPGWDTLLYGVDGIYAFSEFTFDTRREDPTVTFRLIGEAGNIIYELVLRRSELIPSNH